MRFLPVHWSEGMFLRPQHFQAADRHWAELTATSRQWDNHYSYGLHAVEISDEALANYQVQITRCHARMRDGTLVALDVGQEPDRVDLKAALAKESRVTVFLAIPKLALGRANVGAAGQPDESRAAEQRYVETELDVPDESRGGNDQLLRFRDLNARILLSTQELTGYEVLPIARVMRAGEGEAVPQLDEDYFPPVLSIEAWPGLGMGVVRAIYDVLGRNIEVLAERVSQRGVSLATTEPGDLEDLLRLMVLNRSYSALGCMAFASSVHPLLAYTELCRIVGHLAIFDVSRRAKEVPRYDHDDLARIFKWARDEIYRLMKVSKLEYEMRHFIGTDLGMEVSIDSKWVESAWDWYVGVNGENLPEREVRELLRAGNLDWKMGSSQQVDTIFKFRIPGVGLVDLAQPPRALPTRGGWVYYEVRKDPDSTAWRDVFMTKTLAVRFKRELIRNLDTLRGQKRLEVYAHGKHSVLEFALFAVPKQ